jgi:hypothetical protein
MTEVQATYFTRLRGLATVVWDPEKKRSLAHFNKRGLLATTNPRVIKTLDAMGYRRVTAEEINTAGLPMPSETDVPDAMPGGQPGVGYQSPEQGESGVVAGVAMAGGANRTGGDVNQLFEPDPTQPPPGDAGRRKLVR